MSTVIFSHGQESGPWGTKIRSMAETVRSMGLEADSIDYQGIADPNDRAEKLIAEARDVNEPLVLVGSSMGGYVATAAADALGAAGLFLLAPAFYIPGYDDLMPPKFDIPIWIVHGWRDDVVAPENSIRFAESCRAALHLIDGDHRLTDNIDQINNYLRQFLSITVASSHGITTHDAKRGKS